MNYPKLIQSLYSTEDYHIDVLRLDIIDKEISGNKWFKLKYNIEAAQKSKSPQLITFGGAFSNHLAATAAACKKLNMPCTAIVRGEEQVPLNNTLQKAKEHGMHLHFVSREFYDKKNDPEFERYLIQTFGEHYLIPEGGNNDLGISGCKEIMDAEWDYDYIFCACGTGATYSGILASVKAHQKVIGMSVLKGENTLLDDVNKSTQNLFPALNKHICGNEELEKIEVSENCITNTYAFNGYAKFDQDLILFKQQFESDFKIPLDYVYTSKLFYGVFDLIKKKKLKKKSTILVIHSGGLQGNSGFEARYHLMPTL